MRVAEGIDFAPPRGGASDRRPFQNRRYPAGNSLSPKRDTAFERDRLAQMRMASGRLRQHFLWRSSLQLSGLCRPFIGIDDSLNKRCARRLQRSFDRGHDFLRPLTAISVGAAVNTPICRQLRHSTTTAASVRNARSDMLGRWVMVAGFSSQATIGPNSRKSRRGRIQILLFRGGPA